MWTDVSDTLDGEARIELEATLIGWWREYFRREAIEPHTDFFSIGGTSLLGVQIAARVKQRYEVELTYASFYEFRTITGMADLIQLKLNALESSAIVPIRTHGYLPPLFMIHGVGGNVLGFYHLAKLLPPDQPVYGVQAQALQPSGVTLTRLEDMAAHYLDEIRLVQPRGPYMLLGFSYGGLVAFEIARQLKAMEEEVGFLGMLDTRQLNERKGLGETASVLKRILLRGYIVWIHMRRLSLRKKVNYVTSKATVYFANLWYHFSAVGGQATIPESMKSVRHINLNAAASYKVLPYEGQITLFRSEDETGSNLSDDLGWGEYAMDGVNIHEFAGDHGHILAEPNVSLLAKKLTVCLNRRPAEAARAKTPVMHSGRVSA